MTGTWGSMSEKSTFHLGWSACKFTIEYTLTKAVPCQDQRNKHDLVS